MTDAGAGRQVSRRAVLGGSAAVAAGLVTATPAAAAPAAVPAPAAPAPAAPAPAAGGAVGTAGRHRAAGFVRVRNGGFTLDGAPFRFGGTNTYYLHQQSHYMIDAALDDAAAMGLRVVRAWAFADGPARTVMPLQPEPFRYDEDAFDSLDYTVWKAGQLGLRLVLTLANNWGDYGGMRQYVEWFLGLPDDTTGDAVNHDRFYNDARIRNCYRAYAAHVIGRRNRYTGLAYRDDPTIMTFELANEPRNRSDKTGATVLAWVREMSALVKRLAPRQLVAVGDEGFYGDPTNVDYPYSTFEGDRWLEFLRLPAVDYGTFHLYPQGWGETTANNGTDPVQWGTTWIATHLADAARLGKPAVLEEYGLLVDPARDIADAAARQAGYARWVAEVERSGAGDQFWLLTSRVDDGSYYPDFDGYRIYWANDPANPSNDTARMLSAHAHRMAAG
jgi:mannan endo-1,4-beta-mannosidase